jgi:hypothetical protein
LNPEKKEFLPPKVQGGFFSVEVLKNLVNLCSAAVAASAETGAALGPGTELAAGGGIGAGVSNRRLGEESAPGVELAPGVCRFNCGEFATIRKDGRPGRGGVGLTREGG